MIKQSVFVKAMSFVILLSFSNVFSGKEQNNGERVKKWTVEMERAIKTAREEGTEQDLRRTWLCKDLATSDTNFEDRVKRFIVLKLIKKEDESKRPKRCSHCINTTIGAILAGLVGVGAYLLGNLYANQQSK